MLILLVIVAFVTLYATLSWTKSKERGKVTEVKHPYFSRLRYWRTDNHIRWDAEYTTTDSPHANKKVNIRAEDNPEPTIKELEFCKPYLADLSLLFPIVHDGVKERWEQSFHENLPENWQEKCTIEGFTVPVNGDEENSWRVTLYIKNPGQFFYISIKNGVSKPIT